MKISAKGFFLEVFRVFVLSALGYFALKPLTKRFVPFLEPFVFLIIVVLFVTLFYLCVSYYKTFSAEFFEGKLLISKGLLIRRKIQLNLNFAVSTKVLTTPLMRLLKLSNLLLVFEGSVCFLPLLNTSDAEEILLKSREKNEEL